MKIMDNNKIMTAEEYFNEYSNLYSFEEGDPMYLIDKEDFIEVIIEFAKYHVKIALETASEKVQMKLKDNIEELHLNDDWMEVDRNSILNAYPETNIK